jgi:hypothetical protein
MGQLNRTVFGCVTKVQFTNTQIKALPGTTPTLVAGLSGRVIIPHIVAFTLAPWVADYTNIDVTSNIGVNINSVFTPPTLTGAGLLAQGEANFIWGEYSREYDFTPSSYDALLGKPLVLVVTNGAAGPFTGGNATTVLTVTTYYDVVEV